MPRNFYITMYIHITIKQKLQTLLNFTFRPNTIVGRDSSVGTATRYELDGPGIESRRKRDFQHPSRPALGPTQPPVQWVPGHSRG
jgi:hypothetical protein